MATRKRATEIDPLAGKKKSFTPDPKDFPGPTRKGASTKTRPTQDHAPKPKRPKMR